MAPNPGGSTDELATIVLFRKIEDEKIVCAIWHYTCHPTSVIPDDVISADYPGVVRRALQKQFGMIPCIFAQGFCGDIRPNMRATALSGLRSRIQRFFRVIISGPSFRGSDTNEWSRWSNSLAAAVLEIATRVPDQHCHPMSLACGFATIPLDTFFVGSAPDKPFIVQVIKIGCDLEIVALSAEPSVAWKTIFENSVPRPPRCTRLYAGYLGAVFGYLPTAEQVLEGGYEVEGFQQLFGLSGIFDSKSMTAAVDSCVKRAFDQLERTPGP